MESNIKYRTITKEDSESLIELFDIVWQVTADTYIRKTNWMLSSPKFYGICAYDHKKIIGARPSLQTNIYYGDSKLQAVQFVNSCVLEAYRRLGIFSKMNNEFLKLFFDEKKNDLIFNVSVEASKMAHQKNGWVYINALSKMYYFPKTVKFITKANFNIKSLSGTIHYDKSKIPTLDSFDFNLLEIREQYFGKKPNIHTYYDKDFFKWRLNSDSNISLFSIEGIGNIIYKVGFVNNIRVITIGEVFLYEYNKKSLKKIIKLLNKKHQADFIELLITYGHPCYSLYKRIGFIHNPFKKYLNLGVKAVSEDIQKICLKSDNWAISTLDIDTF